MVIRPNKPILFGIVHSHTDIDTGMEQFKILLKGRKFAYIELAPKFVNQILTRQEYHQSPDISAYQRLVVEANKAGLKVIALDKDDTYKRAEKARQERGLKACYYETFDKREKKWCEMLRNTGNNSIAVMHPVHAVEIAKLLKLPEENIFGRIKEYFKVKFHSKVADSSRWFAGIERERIETQRLERRRKKARDRMKRQPRK
ncbi:hypothetical protein KKE06_01550 [Candidatus Micrarchaeota archaeon]|nr:hypothetical protein [Candidatus Micrarchaeota archaeon]MBU1930254.1 hypothetical protein [Candidatus Micrarchaeota archaeon]